MNEMMFILFRVALLIVLAIAVRYIIPYLQKLVDDTELKYLRQIVNDAVIAAEQTISIPGAGAKRKEIVIKFIREMLISKNISISDQQIDSLIESVVYMLNIGKRDKS